MQPLKSAAFEMAVEANVLTDWVKANGMGGIDEARMTTAIEQTKSVYEFVNAPDAALYFTSEYLPTDGSLTLE